MEWISRNRRLSVTEEDTVGYRVLRGREYGPGCVSGRLQKAKRGRDPSYPHPGPCLSSGRTKGMDRVVIRERLVHSFFVCLPKDLSRTDPQR